MFSIPSLYQLSAQSVANYFIDGRYNHLDFYLNSKLSNTIFSLLKDNEKINSRDILDQFSKKFACSKMDLTNVSMSSEITKMLKTQNLESISFGPFFKNGKNVNVNYDIVSLMENSLNEVSRRQLKALKIHEWKRFQMYWEILLANLVPCLESLDLSGSKIKKFRLWMICQEFSNLRTLNIGRCVEVDSLDGISSLKHLEVLNLSRIKFHSHESLKELFDLKKLRMLDISFCGPNIMEKYLECGKVLGELQFLDCSGTDIDKSMVEKLMATHKNLKEVAVLGTIIDFSVFPGINLLNCGTAESILKALDYYTKLRSECVSDLILNRIRENFLESFDEEKHGHLVGKFLETVCLAIEKFKDCSLICQNGIFCLAEFGKESVIKQLQPSSRYHLFNHLLELGSNWLNSISGVAHTLVIRALDEPLVLNQVPPSKIKKLCEYAINCLAQFFNAPDDPKNELSLLEKFWKKLSFSKQLELYKTPNFERYLYLLLKHTCYRTYEYLETHRKEFDFVLDLLCEMSNKNEGSCPPKTLIALCRRYPNEWAERSKFIEIIANMMKNDRLKNSYSEVILGNHHFFMDLLDTNPKRADQAFHAMTILSLFMTSPLAQQKKKTFRDKINDEMTRIGRNFPLKSVSPRCFEPFIRDNGCILRDVLQKSKNENGGAAMWALIVIQGILLGKNEKNIETLKNMKLFNALQGIKAKGIGNLGRKVAGLLNNL